ncbi:hypothetical protein Tsubulata_051303 [Turnera subulata]|uniref:Uncharacterized protein n=1 Tax=Turnera subulata TaxID=218843 RepID=A0A9Q0F2Y4_9ROSI|nr:hypothetical protein Tsubulata_051303 [Turnera subulata]
MYYLSILKKRDYSTTSHQCYLDTRKKRGGWPDGGSSSSKHGIKTSGLTDRGHGGVRKRRSVVTHDGITGTVRSPADDDDGALETTGNEAAKIFAKSVGEESHMAVETTDLGGLKRKSLA